MNHPTVTWITPEEINNHFHNMEYHASQIDFFKEILAKDKEAKERKKKKKAKPEAIQVNLFSPIQELDEAGLDLHDINKLKDLIDEETKKLKWEWRLLEIKLKFFYQNINGVPLPPDSEDRRHHVFTRENYMNLKAHNFDRYAMAKASYLELQSQLQSA